jgi:hypothetical protein
MKGILIYAPPSVGVEQFWDVSKWKNMWMHTSRVEAAYMAGVYMILILTT